LVKHTGTKRILKGIKWMGFILFILILFIFLRPAWTPSISPEKGKTSVASLEKIELGKLKQSVLIRSRDITNPILLFIHGGPGMPIMYLSYAFQRELENKFTVVQWDQRGAGKSYDPKIPTETINVEQYISDAHQLIDTLLRRYHQQKIYLIGHSWGTYLGSILVQRYPELFYAYVSMGQVVDSDSSRMIQRDFLSFEAHKRNDALLISKLKDPDFLFYEKWLFKYGGELRKSTSFVPLIITGLFSPEYTFRDAMNVAKGPQFCGKYMKYNAINGSIMKVINQYNVPVYFMVGSHDYTTPFELIQKYYDSVQAPFKQLIWFNESAHFPFYEEPEKFDRTMIDQVLLKN
jgi:pimeloyl-ACP methyl ester carboxylesterase